MKGELLKILKEYQSAVDEWNQERRTSMESHMTPTFQGFIEWLDKGFIF